MLLRRKFGDRFSSLVRLVPAPGPAGFDDERHRKLAMWRAGAFHDTFDDFGCVLDLGFWHLEQQLVMDLQQQARMLLFAGEGGGNAGHRALYDVGGRALQGSVDRLPLGAAAPRRVGVADPGDPAFTPEDRLDITSAPAIGLDA